MLRDAARCALVALSMTGCEGIRSDLRSVEDATHERVADVTDDADPQEVPEARALLRQPINADTAVRIAMLDNRELRARLREIGVARGELVQASVLPNPVAELEVQPERDSAYSLRAEYDVTGLVLAPIRARAVGPTLDAARYRASSAVVATGYAARAAFYSLQGAEQRLAIANRALDALAAARDAADALHRAGSMREIDFVTQEAAYETERADVAEMELDARDAREALVRVLGIHGGDVAFVVRGTLPSPPEKLDEPIDIEARAIRASFELKERKSRLENLGRRAGLARAEGWIPDVAVDMHALAPSNTPRDARDSEWLISGGVRVTVPIFDRKQGTSSALTSQFEADLERYYGLAADTRSMVRSAHARLVTAHARATQYDKVIVPARKRVVAQALLEYNAMQIGIFQLLGIERSELTAELAGVDARRDYAIARVAFDAGLAGHAVETERSPRSLSASSMAGGE